MIKFGITHMEEGRASTGQ